jgi:hypothetical protein
MNAEDQNGRFAIWGFPPFWPHRGNHGINRFFTEEQNTGFRNWVENRNNVGHVAQRFLQKDWQEYFGAEQSALAMMIRRNFKVEGLVNDKRASKSKTNTAVPNEFIATLYKC